MSATVITLIAIATLTLQLVASPLRLTTTVSPTTASPTPTVRAFPTEVDPIASHNAALGCAPNAPSPQPGILFGGRYRGSALPVPNEVALTFDDGPAPQSTERILTILERTHTAATFFVEGQWVTKYPDLLRREWDDGFAIGNHSWDHPMMSHLTADQLAHQFGDTNTAIHNVIGPDACLWLFRPPYANSSTFVVHTAQSYGLTTIDWDDGSLDWAVPRPTPDQIAHQVLTALHPGSVILMHDGPVFHPRTEAALPLVIQELVARGYLPVTLPRLLADMHYPGVTASGPLPPMPSVPADLLPVPGPTPVGATPTPPPNAQSPTLTE